MNPDEVIRLVFQMLGQDAADKMRASFDALKGSVKTTADSYDVLERQVGEYEVLERRVTETVKVHTTMLDQLGIQLNNQVGSYNAATGRVAAFGQAATMAAGEKRAGGGGILGVSYAAQDFTAVLSGGQGLDRALSSVQNNIPPILMGLGAGAGLAGVVSIVAVGVGLLYSNWDKISELWKKGQTAEEAERMKELAKATEQAVEAGKNLAKTLPPEQRQTQANLKRAVNEFGGPAVLQHLKEILREYQGSFGEEADKGMAQNLFNRLLAGERGAENLLGDLPDRGAIGQVLRGGKTSEEEKRDREEVLGKREQQQQQADERRKKEADDAAARKKKDKDDADDRIRQAGDRMREKRNREGVELGRRVGQAAGRGQPAGNAGGHLPLMPLDADPAQQLAIMEKTQDMMLQQQVNGNDMMQRALARQQIMERLRRNMENIPLPTGMPR